MILLSYILLSGQVSQKTNCEKKVHERNIFHEAWLNDPLELLLSGQVSQKNNCEKKVHERNL